MSTPKLVNAEVICNVEIASGYFILRVKSPLLASRAKPGQFAHIKCGDENGIILRRPFSFHRVEKEDIFFLYQIAGKGTSVLRNRLPGEKISILGPLGNGFSFERNGKKKIAVAGGMGIAPFLFLVREMIDGREISPKDIILVYGAKNKKFLVGLDDFRKSGISIFISTDDGSTEFKGSASELVSHLLKKREFKRGDYFTCGPEEMMKKVTEIAEKNGDRVQVSMEERMACGIGVCLSCVRKVKGEYLRVCREGPVFCGDEVEW